MDQTLKATTVDMQLLLFLHSLQVAEQAWAVTITTHLPFIQESLHYEYQNQSWHRWVWKSRARR